MWSFLRLKSSSRDWGFALVAVPCGRGAVDNLNPKPCTVLKPGRERWGGGGGGGLGAGLSFLAAVLRANVLHFHRRPATRCLTTHAIVRVETLNPKATNPYTK